MCGSQVTLPAGIGRVRSAERPADVETLAELWLRRQGVLAPAATPTSGCATARSRCQPALEGSKRQGASDVEFFREGRRRPIEMAVGQKDGANSGVRGTEVALPASVGRVQEASCRLMPRSSPKRPRPIKTPLRPENVSDLGIPDTELALPGGVEEIRRGETLADQGFAVAAAASSRRPWACKTSPF